MRVDIRTHVTGEFDTPALAMAGIANLIEGKDLVSICIERRMIYDKGLAGRRSYELHVIYDEFEAEEA